MRSVPILRKIYLLALILSSHTLSAQAQEPLWSLVDSAEHESQLQELALPAYVASQSAVLLGDDLDTLLQLDNVLTLTLSSNEELQIAISTENSFVNGDSSVRGIGTDTNSNTRFTITRNTETLLGNVLVDGARHHIVASKNIDGEYIGWLYTQLTDLPTAIVDFGARDIEEDLFEVAAVSGNDVTITQTLSKSQATVGEQVTVNIAVTNNLGTALNNDVLSVLFISDRSEFIGSNSGCISTTNNQLAIFSCPITSLAAGATAQFDYTVQLTADSYPQVPSSAFVGNIFDPNDYVRDDAFIFVNQDTLTDSDGDGITDFNEAILNTDPNDSASVISNSYLAEIDLLLLYTRNFVDELGTPFPETEINQMVELANGYYQDSGAMVSFRPVHYGLVEYDFNNSLESTLNDLAAGNGVFSGVADLREAVGADIVVIIDGLKGSDTACGLADSPGGGFKGELFHPLTVSNEVYAGLYKPGFPPGGGAGCDELTLAHELGHNLGLKHSRRENSSEAALPWGRGYGVDGSFVTIMGYSSRFPGSDALPLFSNPASTACNGLACGISRDDVEQGADSVHAINHTRFQMAAKRSSNLLNVTTLSGGGSSLTIHGTASSGGVSASSFAASAAIDVQATLNIPFEHQGQLGSTYIVISVPGAGLFFVDSNKSYQSWDGNISSLGSYIEPRTLQASETLVAFDKFVPAQFNVSNVSPTVYFAYGINNFEVFAYSAQGITFQIE